MENSSWAFNKTSQQLLENIAFKKLKVLLNDSVGLNCDGYRDEYLRRRFEVRLRATGNNTYSKYLLYLRKNPAEIDKLLQDLTINYSMFFRDTDVYIYVEKNILPRFFRAKTIRIWSAGCATGEEPYSLAILVYKVFGEVMAKRQVTIFASDIDKEALSKAATGKYQPHQLQNLDDSSLNRFFTKQDNAYVIKDFVKQIIRFEQADLMKPPLHQNLDVILCRNVMIYFSRESQQQIHRHFYDSLVDGGYFITGKTEILIGELYKKFRNVDVGARVYQKLGRTDTNAKSEIPHAFYMTGQQ